MILQALPIDGKLVLRVPKNEEDENRPPRGVQLPKELIRIFRRFDHRNAGCVEEFMDDEQEPGRQAETPAQPADLVTIMERSRNRRTTFALASWTAERRPKGWYIRKTDNNGDWRGPYSTIASVSLMIARELGKELARRDSFASRD